MSDHPTPPEPQPTAFPASPPLTPVGGPWAPPSGIVPPANPSSPEPGPSVPPTPSYGPPSYGSTPSSPYAPPPAAGSLGPPFPPGPPTAAVAPPAPQPSRRRGGALVGGVVGAVVAALVATVMWVALPREEANRTVTEVRPSLELDASALDIQTLLSKVRPSVVSIKTGTANGEAAGSGVVLSADGLVLTNAHVVDGASGVEVEFSDGSTHGADLVGSFPTNDVALVKVRGVTDLTAATLGTSDELQVGDDVVAIGNALNLGADPTVTKGIVSAIDRSISAPGVQLENLIQTDAAINPGNSGGPLVNAAGEVVGINTAIIPDSQNLGFSLAIDQIKPLIDQIKEGKGEINADTPFLGVSTTNIEEQRTELLDRFGIDAEAGAFVVEVVEGSAAAEAGLEPGDVIISIDGTEVKSKDDVGSAVRGHKPGDEITVTYLRDGEEHTGTALLGSRTN